MFDVSNRYCCARDGMTEFANGIAWLESLGFTHGDIRPENVLLNNQDHLKVADFDGANLLGSEFETCTP
jgi:serine/threonine protein kinase